MLYFRTQFSVIISYFIMTSYKIKFYYYKNEKRFYLILRSILLPVTASFYYIVGRLIPVADTDAIGMTSSIFTVFLAWIILGEEITFVDVFAGIFGFVGVIFIGKPTFL